MPEPQVTKIGQADMGTPAMELDSSAKIEWVVELVGVVLTNGISIGEYTDPAVEHFPAYEIDRNNGQGPQNSREVDANNINGMRGR